MNILIKAIIASSLGLASYNLYADIPVRPISSTDFVSPDACPTEAPIPPACQKGLDKESTEPNLSMGRVVFDFDGNSCLASSPIVSDGNGKYKINEGLDVNTGRESDNCSYSDQLSKAEVLYKEKCAKTPDPLVWGKYCARVFAIYMVKDSPIHRHDLEHVVLWMKDDKVDEVGTTAHTSTKNKIVSLFPRLSRYSDKADFNSFTVVYHKDGALTHALRPSKSVELKKYNITYNTEAPENPTETWFSPRVVNVDHKDIPKEYKDIVKSGDWGKAKLLIKDDQTLISYLNSKRPGNWRKAGVEF